MARLNEPAPSTETIDTLKRKFMRQNRDIAKANSAQGLRIRTLENETSRLLTENLGLKEHIIRLQNEIENSKAQMIADHAGALRAQLEEKLAEIGTLINGLGCEPTPKKKSPRNGKSSRNSLTQSPDQRNWKNLCTLSEAVNGQDGRLPPILENKSYPRRTLERQEILDLVADAEADTTDSPDIGPPPMSQFVDQDPVKIDLPRKTKNYDSEEVAAPDPVLSINLEQRRKRKDSIAPMDTTQASKIDGIREAAGSLKAGAKRKLSVREDEETQGPLAVGSTSPDDFKYSKVAVEDRTRSKPASQSNSKVEKESGTVKGLSREKPSIVDVATNRKVLAPKTVNNSPRKSTKLRVTDEIKAAKAEPKKSSLGKESHRGRDQHEDPVQIQLPAPVIETAVILPEPETPACLDIFSPPGSQPSTTRIQSRDTPPPPDIGIGGEGHRPSRRSRAAISYAEPNLRDKMRRPTKELVDAVSKDDKPLRGSIVKLEDEDGLDTIKIKAEPEAEDAWKQMPVASAATVEDSPLSSKAPAPDILPSSVSTHRKRRESILNSIEVEGPKSVSGSAIAAMLAENRRAKAAAREKSLSGQAGLSDAMSKLDIYEFRGSSPLSDEKAKIDKKVEKAERILKVPSRISRRNTSAPRDIARQEESEASDAEASKKSEASARRRQSTLGHRAKTTTSELAKAHAAERALKRSASTSIVADSGGTGDSRSERISARRRSMML